MPASDIPEYKPPSGDKAPKGRPPKGASGKGKAKRPPPKPTMPVDEIREDLLDFMIGTGLVVLSRNEVDGIIIIGGAPDLVDSYCALAEKNPYVHLVLQKFCSGMKGASALTTTIPMVLAIAANHGVAVPTPRPFAHYKRQAERVLEEHEIVSDVESGDASNNGHTSGTAAPVP